MGGALSCPRPHSLRRGAPSPAAVLTPWLGWFHGEPLGVLL